MSVEIIIVVTYCFFCLFFRYPLRPRTTKQENFMWMMVLSDDVVLYVMDFLQLPFLTLVCKRFYRLWHDKHICIYEDPWGILSSQRMFCCPKVKLQQMRWIRYSGERFSCIPDSFMYIQTLILHILNWAERWNLCKLLQGCQSTLQRLVLQSTAFVHTATLSALCEQLPRAPMLRSVEVSIRHGHLTWGQWTPPLHPDAN